MELCANLLQKLNKIAVIGNFLAFFFFFLVEKFSLLDLQPCLYHCISTRFTKERKWLDRFRLFYNCTMHRSANFHLFLLGESGRSSSYGSSTSLPVPTFANDTITYFSPALVSFHYTVLAFFPAVFMCVYYFRMTSHRILIKFLTFIIKEVR